MRCTYCNGNVVGDPDVVVLVGEGPAHRSCYERHTVTSRVFGELNIQTLDNQSLVELKEMVLTELNSRHLTQEEDIELFA